MNTPPRKDEYEEQRRDVEHTFTVGLGSLFVCQCYVLLNVSLPMRDVVILSCSLVSTMLMQIGIHLRAQLLLEVLHILFLLFVFFVIPCFARSVHLLALNIVCILVTLGIRAEHGMCALRILESPEERKPYDNWIVDQLNFNVLFALLGIICLMKLAMKHKT